MWTLTKLKLHKKNQTPPSKRLKPFPPSPPKKKYGIYGKQHGERKGKWINPLTAQHNA